MTIHSSFSDIDQTQWQELVEQSSTASFFQTPECYQFFASLSFMKPFVFGVSENDKLVGILSGYIISDGNRIKRYLSKRAIVCGGALLDDNVSPNALEQLLVAARKSLKRKAIYFEIRNYNNYCSYKSTFKTAEFDYSPHLDFHVLTPNIETALKQLNTTKRRDVKLSQKTGASWNETSDSQDLKDYYEILSNLYKTRIKTPLFPFEFFQNLVLQPLGKLFVVKYEGKVIGGSVCVILPGKKIYEWFVCGIDGQIKNVYPSTIATWAAIEYAASNDYSCFDMMGAGKPDDGYGVREFKSKFGGNLIENGRFLCINNPLLYKIGKIAVTIIRSNKKFKRNSELKTQAKAEVQTTFTVEHNIQRINKQEWSDFVLNHQSGNIFQTPKMYEVYHKTPNFSPIIVIAKDLDNKIVGCLMSVIQKDYKGLIGEFTARSIVMGGPLAENNNSEILDILVQHYDKVVSSKAIYSQFRNLFDMKNYYKPFDKNGYKLNEHLDILIDLNQTKEELEKQLHKERRRNIISAEKGGISFKVITSEDEIKVVIELLKRTYHRVKVPFSYEKLFLCSRFILENNVKFFGAFLNEKMIAGQVRLCYKDTVYAWYSGSDADYLQKRPNDYLLWNVLLWSKENNYSVFDFGGAGKPNVPYGVRDYKMKFGGNLVNYGRYEKEHKKLLMLFGRTAFKLYKILNK